MRRPLPIAILLLTCCFSLAVVVEPRLAFSKLYQRHEKSAVEDIFGDARRLFAAQAYIKADAYFHSGYYPSIFDQNHPQEAHIAVDSGAVEQKHEDNDEFLGKPLDWIDKFSRGFYPSTHTHLDEGGAGGPGAKELGGSDEVREILPWLKMTADLDPNRIESYTVGAFWLRARMNRPHEAEEFLRDGLKANPGSYAILFELGRIYFENYKDPARARNLWEAALTRWNQQESGKKDPDTFLLLNIVWHLALVEEQSGNKAKAVQYLEKAKTISPNPAQVQKRIDEIKSNSK